MPLNPVIDHQPLLADAIDFLGDANMRSVWPDLAAVVAVVAVAVVASLAIWGGSVIRQARQELVVEQPQN